MAKEDQFYRIWLSSQWEKKDENRDWNLWREEHPDEEIDLEEANLLGRDLTAANFRRANLRRAVLSGTSLRRADLREANLEGAHLQGADLSEALVEGASFRGAALNETIWEGVKGLTAEQLAEAKDLEKAQGLSEEIWQTLREKAPHLVEWRVKETSS